MLFYSFKQPLDTTNNSERTGLSQSKRFNIQ